MIGELRTAAPVDRDGSGLIPAGSSATFLGHPVTWRWSTLSVTSPIPIPPHHGDSRVAGAVRPPRSTHTVTVEFDSCAHEDHGVAHRSTGPPAMTHEVR